MPERQLLIVSKFSRIPEAVADWDGYSGKNNRMSESCWLLLGTTESKETAADWDGCIGNCIEYQRDSCWLLVCTREY